MKRPARLSAVFVKTVSRPGRYGDGRGGNGLNLLVKPRAGECGGFSKSWSQRVRIDGKPVNIGLGPYPVVTLAEAREAALANRRAVRQGHDPRRQPDPPPTFAEAAEAVVLMLEKNWQPREGRLWRSSLRHYVLPALGARRVNEISAADVLAVLTPLWADRQERARRIRRRIGAVMKWAIAQGHRTDNPAGQAISHALPRSRAPRPHHRALPHTEVAEALRRVRASGAYRGSILCLEFLVLTATRSGEARGARWEEIDLAEAIWSIPAARMKARRPHRVPLSKRALEVSKEAQDIHDGSGLVFPSATGRLMGDRILSALLRNAEIPAVVHGFRASFRTWADEMSDAPRAVMEAALAHKLGDIAEQAYARSDLYDKRSILMQGWADYLSLK